MIKNFLNKYFRGIFLTFVVIFLLVFANILTQNSKIESPLGSKKGYEVFGFAPYWTINKLDNVNYHVLTTLAYFGIPVNPDGTLDKENPGYTTLTSSKAGHIFKEAQANGTKVVLAVTQMDNSDIESLMNDQDARNLSIKNIISLVRQKDLDGVNIDYEYVGDPGDTVRNEFTSYISDFTKKLHAAVPGSHLTVSVYAASVIDKKIFDIGPLSRASDGIFMMAYDFATSSSDTVIPTSPLYGHKQGKYWYDVSSAVADFLKVMPKEKLILGLPWYGYNYPVANPGLKAAKYEGYSYYYYWRGRRYIGYAPGPAALAETYSDGSQVQVEASGWDDAGKVGWIAYREDGIWRMMFLDDPKSLKIKYDFAKDQKLAGVGVWALGFDSGTTDLWSLLSSEFGSGLAYANNE